MDGSTPVYRQLLCDHCGYPRTGLPAGALCPECGTPPPNKLIQTLNPLASAGHSRAEQAWLICVLSGLVLLIVTSYGALQSLMYLDIGGLTLVAINAPAPKLCAGASILRQIGRPEVPGVGGLLAVLGNLVAIWLITEPVRQQSNDEPLFSLRRCARWVPVVTFGALYGGQLGGYDNDIRFWSWYSLPTVIAAIAFVELPSNVLLYFYLSKISRRFDPSHQRRGMAVLHISAWMVGATCLIGSGASIVRGMMQDQPTELWRVVQSVIGALSLASGLMMSGGVFRLLWQVLLAVVDRSILTVKLPLAQVLRPAISWIEYARRNPTRIAAAAGLLIWLSTSKPMLTTTALIGPRRGLGGDLPVLNFIGPKIWAVPLLDTERDYGYLRYWNDSDNRLIVLWTLLSVWLITAYVPRARLKRFATVTRWVPTVLMGLSIGFALTVQRAKTDVRESHWAAAAIIGVEAPCTLLVYLYLSTIAMAVVHATVAKRFALLGLIAAAIISSPLAFYALSRHFLNKLQAWPVLAVDVVYGACVVAASVCAWAVFVQLFWRLVLPMVRSSYDDLRRQSSEPMAEQARRNSCHDRLHAQSNA